MPVVALFNGRNDGNFFAFRVGEFRQSHNVARERAAGERAARSEIRLGTDTRFTLEAGRNFLGVRAGVLAEARDFVDEGDGEREEGIERVLDNLRRLGAHEQNLRRERREQFFEQSFFCVVADANDDTLGFLEGVNRLAQPQIFRRAGEMELRKFLFQLRAGADGQLRGNQNERAFRQIRQRTPEIGEN